MDLDVSPNLHGVHCTEKTGIISKKIWCAQVLNSLIQKIKDIVIFATKFPNSFFRTEWVPKSVLPIKHPQITEIGTGKSWGQTGKQGIRKQNLSGDPESTNNAR